MKYLLIFLLFNPLVFSIGANPGISARSFRKSPGDHGYRKAIKDLTPSRYSFWRFLESYLDAPGSYESTMVMMDYYEKYSQDIYRVLSLMFLYNSYDPMDKRQEDRMMKFLGEHLHEPSVLALFLYRYRTIPYPRQFSYRKLMKRLRRETDHFLVPEFSTLLFFDYQVAREMTGENWKTVQRELAWLYKNEIRKNSLVYQQNKAWIRKLSSFYTLMERRVGMVPMDRTNFLFTRAQLFRKHGYSYEKVLEELESLFLIPKEAMRLPDFLPRHLHREFHAQLGLPTEVFDPVDSPFAVKDSNKDP